MKLDILNKEGSKAGRKVDLPDEIFGIEPNDHVLYLAVKQYLAEKRTGNHKTKERGEIRGSRRKIKKQKGTGSARAGDIKNPLFRGGGRAFGPRVKSYDFKLNKKTKALARNSALSYKAKDKGIVVVEDIAMDAPKTKDFAAYLNNLGAEGKKALYVMGDRDDNVIKSISNLPKTKISAVSQLNVYDIMNANLMVISESGVKWIAENFNN